MKDNKVFTVHTNIYDKDEKSDINNYSSYTIIAHDAKEAIEKVENEFDLVKDEYVVSIDLICTLDE